MRAALVVGGSGMLAGLVHRLSAEPRPVMVLARGADRLRRVRDTAPGPGTVVPVARDYSDLAGLADDLAALTGAHGPFGTIVGWVRTAYRVHVWRELARHAAVGALLVDVKGSTAVRSADPVPALVAGVPGARYRRVLLGHVDDGRGHSRWLTHAEIVDGVAAALTDGASEHNVVGRLGEEHP